MEKEENLIWGHSSRKIPLRAVGLGCGRTAGLVFGPFSGAPDAEDAVEALFSVFSSVDGGRIGRLNLPFFLRTNRILFAARPNPDAFLLPAPKEEISTSFEKRRGQCEGTARQFPANGRRVEPGLNFNAGFPPKDTLKAVCRESGTRCGAFPESEPESRAAAGLVRLLRPRLILILEGGREIFAPPCDLPLARLIRRFSDREPTAPPNGSLVLWAEEELSLRALQCGTSLCDRRALALFLSELLML